MMDEDLAVGTGSPESVRSAWSGVGAAVAGGPATGDHADPATVGTSFPGQVTLWACRCSKHVRLGRTPGPRPADFVPGRRGLG